MNLDLKSHRKLTLVIVLLLISLIFLWSKPYFLSKRNYNVILITIDSLKPDHLGCYGYHKDTSPNLDRIAKEGILFSNAYSTASWTIPGLISLLTSLYPSVHTVDSRDKHIPANIPTFPSILKTKGYIAPAFCFLSTTPEFVNMGFDELKNVQLTDDDRMLIPWLKENKDKKFFLWYHYTVPHLPYNPPQPYLSKFYSGPGDIEEESEWIKQIRSLPVIRKETVMEKGDFGFSQEDKERVISLYDGDVAYLDAILGKFIDELKSLNLWDRTILIITADHGEELFEHGFIGHASTSLDSSLYNELLRIPLIMRFPDKRYSQKRVDIKVSLIDVLPTVLDYLGIEKPQTLQGISLIPYIKGVTLTAQRQVFVESSRGGYQSPEGKEPIWEKAILLEDWKLVSINPVRNLDLTDRTSDISNGVNEKGLLKYELYNLTNDPRETKDFISQQEEIALRLKMHLGLQVLSNSILRSKLTTEEEKEEVKVALIDEVPTILRPLEKEILDFNLNNAEVILEWIGEDDEKYIVEYSVGKDDLHLSGKFDVRGKSKNFGPIYQETWQLLSYFNPFRFRVKYYTGKNWSEWRKFYF